MSAFETTILPLVSVLGVCAAIAWGAWCSRQLKIAAIRKAAFDEAGEALVSLSSIAFKARDRYVSDGEFGAASEAGKRAYYYDRAAMIVRSIPAERA